MEQLNNIEAAVNAVQKLTDRKERIVLLNKLLEGIIDVDTKHGKELLHRRALFVTELGIKKLWPE